MLGTDKEPGIYVRTLNDLFRAIEETSDDMLYSVSMSYLEVGTSGIKAAASRPFLPFVLFQELLQQQNLKKK